MQLHCYFKFMFLTEWTLQGQVSSPGLQRADAIKQTGLCSCCIWNNPSESCCAVHGAEKAALSPLVPQETHIQKWHSILIVLDSVCESVLNAHIEIRFLSSWQTCINSNLKFSIKSFLLLHFPDLGSGIILYSRYIHKIIINQWSFSLLVLYN